MSGPIIKSVGPGTFPEANYYEVGPTVNVFSWCPSSDGTGPATQVHLHFGRPGSPQMVVRFKSAAMLDPVIDALVKHREDVWGKR